MKRVARRRIVHGLACGLTFVAAGSWSGLGQADPPFEHHPPGDLLPGSGEGYVTDKVYVPGIRFPLEEGPAFPNSQVYGIGGSYGPPGGQCDPANFDYPWRDNFCETRHWTDGLNLCPLGKGHQGQDIRAATCEDQVHWIVAAQAGTVAVGDTMVYVTSADGIRHRYGHGRQVAVWDGQQVGAATRLAKVSNRTAGGGNLTSIHLHYDIRMDVAGHGWIYVPPYTSLIPAYIELMDFDLHEEPRGYLDAADCSSIAGWTQDLDVPDQSIDVELYFDGEVGVGTGVTTQADVYRQDLCDAIGSCPHGFVVAMPRSLRDDTPHTVHAYGVDDEGMDNTLLVGSPKEFTCSPLLVPEGRLRSVPTPEHLAAWGLSPFWDATRLDPSAYDELQMGPPMGLDVDLVTAEGGSGAVFLLEFGERRLVPDETFQAWGFANDQVRTVPNAELAAFPQGSEFPAPFLVWDGARFGLIDLLDCEDDCGGEEAGGEGGEDEGMGGETGTAGGLGDESGDGFPAQLGDAPMGCGCRQSGESGGWAALALCGLGLARRRRSTGRPSVDCGG